MDYCIATLGSNLHFGDDLLSEKGRTEDLRLSGPIEQ